MLAKINNAESTGSSWLKTLQSSSPAAAKRSGSFVQIDDEDNRLTSGEIVAPEHANPVSASDVPHLQSDVLVLDTLDIETDRGDRARDLAQLQLVEDRGLARCVQADHYDAGFMFGEQAGIKRREADAHAGTNQMQSWKLAMCESVWV